MCSEDHVVVLVLRLQRAIDRGRAVAVFLVPLPHFEQRRHLQRLRREPFVHRLQRPEFRVGRVVEELANAGQLLDAQHLGEIRGGAGFQETRVVVARAQREIAAAVGLVGALADREDSEPMRNAPLWNQSSPIQPSTIGLCGTAAFNAGCGLISRHQRGEAQIRATDDADLAVRLGRVLHQPFDGVVGIGRFVDAGVVQRPGQRPVQHPRALGAMQAANVLVDADVAVFEEFGVHHFEDVDAALARDAMRRLVRVIRSARQQDGRVRRALLHHDGRCRA